MNMFYSIEEERKGRGWDFNNNRSVNATNAYLDGERPISFWTKGAILKLLVERGCCPDVIAKLKGMPLWLMKDLFLSEATKHHIGKRFKPVMFFWLDKSPENLNEFYNLISKRKDRFSLKFISDEKAKKWAKEMISEYYDTIISSCSSLKSIVIPDGVTEIGRCAFSGCSSLENITLPDGVIEIGIGAFEGCTSLKNIALPDGVTEIEKGAFYGCKSLENITLPDGVAKIGPRAFLGCKSLKNIIIPESVTEIGESAFFGCENLKKVSLPKRVKLGEDVFLGCHPDLEIIYRD